MGEKARSARSVLIVTDVQPDFLPGGALGVEGGDRILEPVRNLMACGRVGLQVATQDWHPPNHISFASRHGRKPLEVIDLYGHEQTLWPDHCVQGSEGARLSSELDWRPVSAIVRKGEDPECDSYSTFRNNWNRNGERPRTGLAGYLRERDIEEVYLCGLARDFCVKWSAEDAVEAGFRTYVIWDATCPVDPASNDDVKAGFEGLGINIIDSDSLLG